MHNRKSPQVFTLVPNNRPYAEKRQKGILKKLQHLLKLFRDSYRIQTYNLLIRSQMLYSVELASQFTMLDSSIQEVTRIGFKPITF